MSGETYRFRVRVSWVDRDAHNAPLLDAVTLVLDGQTRPSPNGTWPEVAWRTADGTFRPLDQAGQGCANGERRYLSEDPVPRDGPPTLRIRWPHLNVATTQNGRASVVVRRNEQLTDGTATDSAFVMRTATVTAPEVATPSLVVTQALPLTGADLGRALTAAIGDLFGTAEGPPVTIQLAHGHQLVGTVRSWWPVGLYPHQPLGPSIGATVAAAADAWEQCAHPSPVGAAWSIAVSLSSNVPGCESRPLLTLQRLIYEVPGGEGSP
ncbi:hypothetical protein ACH4RA_18645 [Streptomyces smyrnaeus]|nr:hypothetical protein [Streptomyces sp. B15]MBQ1122962.1 hypothetical protein [Streptomyces sp. B15]